MKEKGTASTNNVLLCTSKSGKEVTLSSDNSILYTEAWNTGEMTCSLDVSIFLKWWLELFLHSGVYLESRKLAI